MDVATLVMVVIAIILGVIAYAQEPPLLFSGLRVGGKMLWEVLLLLLAAFAIAGLVQVLIPKEFIGRWIGKQAGFKGILIACVAGGITPGGPYVSFPIVAAFYKAGAGIGPIVAYVTAWSLWAGARLPMEIGLIGPKVTLIRFVSTFIFPPIAGLIAQTLFSKVA